MSADQTDILFFQCCLVLTKERMSPLAIFLQQVPQHFLEIGVPAVDNRDITDLCFEAHFQQRVEQLGVPGRPSIGTSHFRSQQWRKW